MKVVKSICDSAQAEWLQNGQGGPETNKALLMIPAHLRDGIAKFQFCPAIQYSFNQTWRLKTGIDFRQPFIGPKGSTVYTELQFDPSYAFLNIHNLFLYQLTPNNVFLGDRIRPTYLEFGYVHNFVWKGPLSAYGVMGQYSIPCSRQKNLFRQYLSLLPYIECRLFHAQWLKNVAIRIYFPVLPNLRCPHLTVHLASPQSNRNRPLGYDHLNNFDLYAYCLKTREIPEQWRALKKRFADKWEELKAESVCCRVLEWFAQPYLQEVWEELQKKGGMADEIITYAWETTEQNPWIYFLFDSSTFLEV